MTLWHGMQAVRSAVNLVHPEATVYEVKHVSTVLLTRQSCTQLPDQVGARGQIELDRLLHGSKEKGKVLDAQAQWQLTCSAGVGWL